MYKPLPKELTIKPSQIHGLGLFATENIPKETVLGITHLEHQDHEDGWIRTPLGGFYNHSQTPNCELIVSHVGLYERRMIVKQLITINDIKVGEELTCTYTLWTEKDITQLKSISRNIWLGL